MSDPVTNAEIEDVLSSIRRLVSSSKDRPDSATEQEDNAAAGVQGETAADSEEAAAERLEPDALVLTPALRIPDEPADEDSVAAWNRDADEDTAPGTEVDSSAVSGFGSGPEGFSPDEIEFHPVHETAAEEPVADGETSEAEAIVLPEGMPTFLRSAMERDEAALRSAIESGKASIRVDKGEDPGTPIVDALDDPVGIKTPSLSDGDAESIEDAPLAAGQEDPEAKPDSDMRGEPANAQDDREDPDPPRNAPRAGFRFGPRQAEVIERVPYDEADASQADADGSPTEAEVVEGEHVSRILGGLRLEADSKPEPNPAEEALSMDSPEPPEASSEEPDHDDVVETEATENGEDAASHPWKMGAFADVLSGVAPSRAREDVPNAGDQNRKDDELDENIFETALTPMDEEMLRALVVEIVHEELRGKLGEKITQNVRKLVRREIHRTLAARDFD
ncbi:hypothetical protein CLV78_10470 [Aliiruegeria haliotis]|uniref:Uncharacterized protein n=1 Tax=Aliiruegeria haliotis TaxID=1280846 RepID=A0A2T0RR51_9RHOB|nr:hypothetical protein [Aliiruegeria haliotis]PRY23580.1 hypothetical protein CLV78_10470 [Aliiruegeria haliotis]